MCVCFDPADIPLIARALRRGETGPSGISLLVQTASSSTSLEGLPTTKDGAVQMVNGSTVRPDLRLG